MVNVCNVHTTTGGDFIPRNKHPEETRKRILDAAAVVFVEKGYEESTILDIVAATDGLTRGAFYHHFKSKEEVLDALSAKIFQDKNPFLTISQRTDLNGRQKLQHAMITNMTDYDDEYRALRMATVHLMKSPKFLAEHIHFNADAAQRYIQPLIEEGVRDGSLVVQSPRLVAELFILLLGVWIPSFIFTGDETYLFEKGDLATKILENLGLDIFGEEFEEVGTQILHSLHETFNQDEAKKESEEK